MSKAWRTGGSKSPAHDTRLYSISHRNDLLPPGGREDGHQTPFVASSVGISTVSGLCFPEQWHRTLEDCAYSKGVCYLPGTAGAGVGSSASGAETCRDSITSGLYRVLQEISFAWKILARFVLQGPSERRRISTCQSHGGCPWC